MLNLNFWIALLQLFAFFVVLCVLWIILALRTSPLDNEEDDDEKDDNCEKDPDDDRYQKSIGILLGWVDCVLEKNRFLSRCIFKSPTVCSAQCLLAVIDAPVECLLISHSLLIKMNCPGTL